MNQHSSKKMNTFNKLYSKSSYFPQVLSRLHIKFNIRHNTNKSWEANNR